MPLKVNQPTLPSNYLAVGIVKLHPVNTLSSTTPHTSTRTLFSVSMSDPNSDWIGPDGPFKHLPAPYGPAGTGSEASGVRGGHHDGTGNANTRGGGGWGTHGGSPNMEKKKKKKKADDIVAKKETKAAVEPPEGGNLEPEEVGRA